MVAVQFRSERRALRPDLPSESSNACRHFAGETLLADLLLDQEPDSATPKDRPTVRS